MLGPAEWPLGIDDPFLALKLIEQPVELARTFQMSECTEQVKFVSAIGAAEHPEELAPEPFAEHPDRQEESPAAGDPARVVRGQSAGRNQAVQVRMRAHLLIPGVQHRKEANPRSQAAS